MSGELFLDNSNVIKMPLLTNSATGLADTGASMSVTLLDSSGTEVAGETWPVSMAHAGAGEYRATLASAITIAVGEVYTAKVVATGSGGQTGRWNCRLRAEERWCD